MISGRSIEAMYDVVEAPTPGRISSVTHAPPTTSRRSSTRAQAGAGDVEGSRETVVSPADHDDVVALLQR